jgi:hypothetical protein
MHAADMREKLFTIRMNEEERERAERLAQHHGLNVAGLIRMLLRREEHALSPAGRAAAQVLLPAPSKLRRAKR